MNPSRHKIISAMFAIVFAVGLQLLTGDQLVFRYLVPALFLFLLGLTFYNWRYLVCQNQYTPWLLVRVPLFVLIWFGLLFIIPFGLLRSAFLVAGVVIMFVFETLVANHGQQLGWNMFLLSLVSLLLGLYGLRATLFRLDFYWCDNVSESFH